MALSSENLDLSGQGRRSWQVTFELRLEVQIAVQREMCQRLSGMTYEKTETYLITFLINKQEFIFQIWLVGVLVSKELKIWCLLCSIFRYCIPGNIILSNMQQQIISDGISIKWHKLEMRAIMLGRPNYHLINHSTFLPVLLELKLFCFHFWTLALHSPHNTYSTILITSFWT